MRKTKPARRKAPVARQRDQLALLISTILAASAAGADPATSAATPAASGVLEEVIVTAQKRTENLQTVPISIQALDSKRLTNLQVASFESYAKYLPSLSFQTYGPGQAQLYVRGVTNGGDGLHVGSEPLVGVYVDEMPVTTIANNLDVHIYDIARVEALSGPQGTLFGASSMAGTLRIITNKPDPRAFAAGYDVTADTFTMGAPGGKLEGFVNLPLSDRAAVRLVAYGEHDGGYINNVHATRVFPTSGVVEDNAASVKRRINEVDTSGGRAALKLDLGDHWTVTPTLMAQRTDARGSFAYSPALGDLNVARYLRDDNLDKWWQAALTVEGKIADFDVVYAGGFLHRTVDNEYDYSDYSYFYDRSYINTSYATYYGDNFRNNQGNLISPAQYVLSRNLFTKQSHELRLSTPKDWRLHGVLGIFLQRQYNYTRDEYHVDGLADQYSITNLPGIIYMNSQRRTDRDRAAFTDWSYDLTSKLTLTGGLRIFGFDNTVYGFFGYNGHPTYDGYVHGSGEQQCFPGTQTMGTLWPCVNIDSRATKRGETHRINLTYKFDLDRMVYATWSTGFRPGGVNRVRTRPPYTPDYLTNFEAGWKTEWYQHRLRFNGALFFERWKDAQFGITGLNGITELINAGRAEIKGVETDVEWVATEHLTLSGSVTALDAKMATNVCKYSSPSLSCTEPNIVYNPDGSVASTQANSVVAPAGSRLPVSPKLKGNLIARYQFSIGGYEAHVQGAMVAQSNVLPSLQADYRPIIGVQPGYASFDFAAGLKRNSWQAELFLQNAFDRRGEAIRYNSCAPTVCTPINVIPIGPRMVGVSFGQKF